MKTYTIATTYVSPRSFALKLHVLGRFLSPPFRYRPRAVTHRRAGSEINTVGEANIVLSIKPKNMNAARPRVPRHWPLWLFGACWLWIASLANAQSITQNVTLNPGWNSLFLEVTPANPSVAQVFSNPAIDSVWEPKVRVSTVAFIQNQNEAPFNRGGWMVYVPTNRPESLNNDLFSVHAGHAYLVKVTGNTAVSLALTGPPSLHPVPFQADAFTLRGFPVDPLAPPTFRAFFASSPAHYQAASGALQRIYRLNNATALWELVAPGDTISFGVAYWVYTAGASSYMGPLTLTPSVGDSLSFGPTATEKDLTIQNTAATPITYTIKNLSTGNPPLTYYATLSNSLVRGWIPFPANFTSTLAPGASQKLRLGIQRSQMASDSFANILSISDGLGSQYQLAVTAQRPNASQLGKASLPKNGSPSATGASAKIDAAALPVALQAGLWVGDVTVDSVAETYVNTTKTTPVKAPFDMRLLLHVTTNGTTRFLREVIEMYQTGTYTTNSDGQRLVDQPGQYVLLTDDALIPQYTGVALRDGTPVGRRISTAGFDFDPPAGTNFLTLNGTFGVGNTVSGTITLTPQSPTNPFLHRFHPDHDNMDSFFNPIPATNTVQEVYTITRQFQLQFAATDPTTQANSDYGYNEIGGVYSETITGLHRNPLATSGTFHLRRLVTTPVLNQNQ